MALVKSNDITPEALIERFQAAVVDNILSDVYHAGRIPMCRGNQCVPTNMMDHINNVTKVPNIGTKPNVVNAATVLNGLISITRNLTRVGTFAFSVFMRNTEGGSTSNGTVRPDREWPTPLGSLSGKVLFTNAHIRNEMGNPADIEGTVYGETIKADNLNQLLSNIFQTWSSANRDQHTGDCTVCHCNCHWNCHYDCHSNCHSTCHGWTIIKDQ